MAITLNGGTGVITGVAVGGLPDGCVANDDLAGSIADGKITGLTASKLTGALPAISGASLTGISGGKVLQVINTQINAGTDGVSNNAWADSTITNSITPSATGSRVLIMAHFVATQYNTSGDGGWSLRFKEAISGGATNYPEELSSGTNSNYHTFNYWGGTETYNRYIRESVHFVASPNTTSAVTYTLQYGTYNMEGFSIGNNGTSGKTILTLIEIGA